MADPTTKTFGQLVQDQAVAIQARAAGLVDFTVGSIIRAASEAVAGVVLWLQGLILLLLLTTRASTCQGADLDSWIADWEGPPRLGQTSAVGVATFARASASQQAVVSVGATIQSLDGSQSYTVNLDTSNPTYNAGLAGYVLPIGTTSVNVSVTAVTPGAAGNAVAGAVNTIASAIPGIDTVVNGANFTGGQDAETDAAYLARFQAWLRALREATPAALQYYLQSLQSGVLCAIVEGQTHSGVTQAGYFYFVVDDGTGSPSATLLAAASVAVNAHRAAGIQAAVYAPTITTLNVVAAINTFSTVSAQHTATCNTVAAAVTGFLSTQKLQATVTWDAIIQVIRNASTDVEKVTSLTINGGSADVVPGINGVVKPGSVAIS